MQNTVEEHVRKVAATSEHTIQEVADRMEEQVKELAAMSEHTIQEVTTVYKHTIQDAANRGEEQVNEVAATIKQRYRKNIEMTHQGPHCELRKPLHSWKL